MALTLVDFRPIGLAAGPLHVGDDGRLTAAAPADAKTIDCRGRYLSPGWCDLHVHVWFGGTDISVRPEQAGRATGVTAMADAGSAGEAAFQGLRDYIIDPAAETIRAFLNIGSIGLVACNRVPELVDPRFVDIDRTLAVIEAHGDVICGVKVRASGNIVGSWGLAPVRMAKRVAEIAGLPLMVHVGEPPPLIDEIFDLLGEGDIVTHCFNGKAGGSIRDTEALFARAAHLAASGIRLDVGHGAASFDFDVARAAVAEGLLPYSISTDLHRRNIDGPVHDLATTLSKLLALGLPFEEGMAAVTERPRAVLGLGRPGLGERADFTLFELEETSLEVVDSQGARLTLGQAIRPWATVIGSSFQPARRRGS